MIGFGISICIKFIQKKHETIIHKYLLKHRWENNGLGIKFISRLTLNNENFNLGLKLSLEFDSARITIVIFCNFTHISIIGIKKI